LLRKRIEQSVLVDKTELEKLSAESTTAVVAGLETSMELSNCDRPAFEQDLSQALHWSILTRNRSEDLFPLWDPFVPVPVPVPVPDGARHSLSAMNI